MNIRKSLFIFIFAAFFGSQPAQAEFIGKSPTGLFELQDVKHPVYMFVPEQYQAEKDYPLIIAIPGAGKSPEDYIKQWTGLATSTSLIVMVPSIQPREGESPVKLDQWILEMKQDVMDRYRISKSKIFLIGQDSSASYAGYLAAARPEEFSAAALLNGSWAGAYGVMVRPQGRPRKQVPFYVALKSADQTLLSQTEKFALKLQKKGYPVYMERLEENEDFASKNFQKRMMTWLQEKSESWQAVIKDSEKKLKEKVYRTVERNVKTE